MVLWVLAAVYKEGLPPALPPVAAVGASTSVVELILEESGERGATKHDRGRGPGRVTARRLRVSGGYVPARRRGTRVYTWLY